MQAKVPVVSDFRYLGIHLNTSGNRRAATLDSRAERACAQLVRAARAAAAPKSKANNIRVKIQAGALYGIEGTDYTDKQIARLSAKTIDVFKKRNNRYDLDWWYATCSHGPDLDMALQIFVRRVIGFRRAYAKQPYQQTKLRNIIRLYARDGRSTKWLHNEDDVPGHEPAPHPSSGSTKVWRAAIAPMGPIGLMIQSRYMIGAKVDACFRIWQPNEVALSITETPYQHLQPLIIEAGQRARTAARCGTKTINQGLKEIDLHVTRKAMKELSDEDQEMLRTVHSGGGFSMHELKATGAVSHSTCNYCRAEVADIDHILWQCPHFHSQRTAIDEKLANIDCRLISRALRRGYAPTMQCDADATYWGCKVDAVQAVCEDIKKMLGSRRDMELAVAAKLQEAMQEGMNARQLMAKLRGAFGTGGEPAFPFQVEGATPEQPNSYIDGGLICPSTQWWALGGFGVWWPNQVADENYLQEMPQEQGQETYAFQDITEHGIGLWGKMVGQRNSSTRMEIVASIIVLTRATPITIASDSKAMIDKAMRLKEAATKLNDDPQAAWWPLRNPMGKPWGLQADGDLWKLMWEALLTRGPHAVTWVKVKGHAKAEHIKAGIATQAGKEGNDWADYYATRGISEHDHVAVKWPSGSRPGRMTTRSL